MTSPEIMGWRNFYLHKIWKLSFCFYILIFVCQEMRFQKKIFTLKISRLFSRLWNIDLFWLAVMVTLGWCNWYFKWEISNSVEVETFSSHDFKSCHLSENMTSHVNQFFVKAKILLHGLATSGLWPIKLRWLLDHPLLANVFCFAFSPGLLPVLLTMAFFWVFGW